MKTTDFSSNNAVAAGRRHRDRLPPGFLVAGATIVASPTDSQVRPRAPTSTVAAPAPVMPEGAAPPPPTTPDAHFTINVSPRDACVTRQPAFILPFRRGLSGPGHAAGPFSFLQRRPGLPRLQCHPRRVSVAWRFWPWRRVLSVNVASMDPGDFPASKGLTPAARSSP